MNYLDYMYGASLATALALGASSAAGAGFTPIPLNSSSYNQDVVIERTAPPPPIPLTTASMDNGTANTAFGWYEQGFNTDNPDTGLPAAGSTITSETFSDHTYTLASSYTNNNAVLVDSTL